VQAPFSRGGNDGATIVAELCSREDVKMRKIAPRGLDNSNNLHQRNTEGPWVELPIRGILFGLIQYRYLEWIYETIK
jgi:hypothetical protein